MAQSIKTALTRAEILRDSDTARLDTELLLAHVLQCSRIFLFSHPESELDVQQWATFLKLMERRATGEPVAYLLGRQSFWTLELDVSPAVLIPRPETELLVETALTVVGDRGACCILDLGTGSGAIALALASEKPNWDIIATDSSEAALAVAQANAQRLGLDNVSFHRGEWFAALPDRARFDLIVSNPPYIADGDPHLQASALPFEPQTALVSDDAGLADLRHIICGALAVLQPGATLLLEHGHDQGAVVRELLSKAGYATVQTLKDLSGHDRLSKGCRPRESNHAG